MKSGMMRESLPGTSARPERPQVDKQMLALNALTNLAKRFSNKPDFHALIETLILTLAGQFSVANAFAKLVRPGSRVDRQLYFATGRFRINRLLESVELSDEHSRYFLEVTEPQHVAALSRSGPVSNLGFILAECQVSLVAPLLHDNRVIGILGLGNRVTGQPFESSDLELMTTFVNTITPLIVNSFLFYEISQLSDWYLQILDSVQQGVLVFDSSFRLKKVNVPGFNILKRFRPHLTHIQSLHQAPIQLVFPDDIFPGWMRVLTRQSTGRKGRQIERLKAKHGAAERIFIVRVSTVMDESESVSDMIVSLDDITEQEENEQRLFDLQKFAEQGKMASSISHELNNFLGLLLGGVELSQVALGKGEVDKATNTLEKLKANIAKMERFTTGLMDFVKLETRKKPGNLNSIVGDVLSFVTVQKKFNHISVQTDLDQDLPDSEIDADQMAQLLLNLLNNAADAIKEAGQESGRILVQTRGEGGTVHLRVSDNGTGIDPDVKDRLFKQHLTTKEGGHGYGLMTCRKIIENHGGQVDIIDEPGPGTTFVIQFPAVGSSASS